jgi:hypothetical protein
MKIKIRKTDKRFAGHEHMSYVVDVVSDFNHVPIIAGRGTSPRRLDRLKHFHEVRQWCVETWGMSCEREHYLTILETDPTILNPHWCWHTEFYDVKIYLASEKEVMWFKLRWL